MKGLRFYGWMARLGGRQLQSKLLMVGCLVPVVSVIGIMLLQSVEPRYIGFGLTQHAIIAILCTMIASFMVGVAIVHLMRPVNMTAQAIRTYSQCRATPDLPTQFGDDVGVMMADAQTTLVQLEGALAHLDRFDPVTGVLNRTGLLAHLRGQPTDGFVLLAIRLTNGHRARKTCEPCHYDQLHQVLVKRMASQFGTNLRARISDLDYIILMPDTAEPLDAKVFRLRASLDGMSEEIGLGLNRVTPELMAGFAPLDFDVAAAIDNAMAAARMATLSSPIAVHSAQGQDRLRDDFMLERDLRKAISDDELVLHYQPVMDMSRADPVGAEALIRWNSPSRGMVPPNSFIPLAEASGLIDPIGMWVLRNACLDLAKWGHGKTIAINLGARQFMDPHLDKHVAEAIADAGIRGDQLEIELTETVATVDHQYTQRTFHKLRDMGVRIAIDDFGTGYASMSMLHKLPFQKLKIDREFVAGVDHARDCQAICSALIALGNGLEIEVLAEGTETAAEVSYLTSKGCNLFQGYYFSRPVPVDQITTVFQSLSQRAAG